MEEVNNNQNQNQNQLIEMTLEEKRKIDDRKNFTQAANVIIGIFNNINRRHKAIKDPATRYALLVDKLCLSLDTGMAVMKMMMEELDIEPEMKIKIEDTSTELQEQLIGLMDWIQNPTYGPDHPYGHSVMKGAENNFYGKTE